MIDTTKMLQALRLVLSLDTASQRISGPDYVFLAPTTRAQIEAALGNPVRVEPRPDALPFSPEKAKFQQRVFPLLDGLWERCKGKISAGETLKFRFSHHLILLFTDLDMWPDLENNVGIQADVGYITGMAEAHGLRLSDLVAEWSAAHCQQIDDDFENVYDHT